MIDIISLAFKLTKLHVTDGLVDSTHSSRVANRSLDAFGVGLVVTVATSKTNLAQFNRLLTARSWLLEVVGRGFKHLDLLPNPGVQRAEILFAIVGRQQQNFASEPRPLL